MCIISIVSKCCELQYFKDKKIQYDETKATIDQKNSQDQIKFLENQLDKDILDDLKNVELHASCPPIENKALFNYWMKLKTLSGEKSQIIDIVSDSREVDITNITETDMCPVITDEKSNVIINGDSTSVIMNEKSIAVITHDKLAPVIINGELAPIIIAPVIVDLEMAPVMIYQEIICNEINVPVIPIEIENDNADFNNNGDVISKDLKLCQNNGININAVILEGNNTPIIDAQSLNTNTHSNQSETECIQVPTKDACDLRETAPPPL